MLTKGAVIVDGRDIGNTIERHEKFLPSDWSIIHLRPQINSIQDYNNFLTSRYMWEGMPDVVLIFQQDSGLLCTGIEEFFGFDFIGANIKWMPGYMNGGLSLRTRASMLKVIDNVEYHGENEDLFFVDGLRKLGGVLPEKELCDRFSVETEYHLGSLGYHAIDKYLDPIQCKNIMVQYD
jgi:hypothetical protein